jgi:hypothetical protein
LVGIRYSLSWSRISENKKNPNHDSWKLKFAIFENFTNNGESIKDINTPFQSQIMAMGENGERLER